MPSSSLSPSSSFSSSPSWHTWSKDADERGSDTQNTHNADLIISEIRWIHVYVYRMSCRVNCVVVVDDEKHALARVLMPGQMINYRLIFHSFCLFSGVCRWLCGILPCTKRVCFVRMNWHHPQSYGRRDAGGDVGDVAERAFKRQIFDVRRWRPMNFASSLNRSRECHFLCMAATRQRKSICSVVSQRFFWRRLEWVCRCLRVISKGDSKTKGLPGVWLRNYPAQGAVWSRWMKRVYFNNNAQYKGWPETLKPTQNVNAISLYLSLSGSTTGMSWTMHEQKNSG